MSKLTTTTGVLLSVIAGAVVWVVLDVIIGIALWISFVAGGGVLLVGVMLTLGLFGSHAVRRTEARHGGPSHSLGAR